jgi:hypothetical protein
MSQSNYQEASGEATSRRHWSGPEVKPPLPPLPISYTIKKTLGEDVIVNELSKPTIQGWNIERSGAYDLHNRSDWKQDLFKPKKPEAAIMSSLHNWSVGGAAMKKIDDVIVANNILGKQHDIASTEFMLGRKLTPEEIQDGSINGINVSGWNANESTRKRATWENQAQQISNDLARDAFLKDAMSKDPSLNGGQHIDPPHNPPQPPPGAGGGPRYHYGDDDNDDDDGGGNDGGDQPIAVNYSIINKRAPTKSDFELADDTIYNYIDDFNYPKEDKHEEEYKQMYPIVTPYVLNDKKHTPIYPIVTPPELLPTESILKKMSKKERKRWDSQEFIRTIPYGLDYSKADRHDYIRTVPRNRKPILVDGVLMEPDEIWNQYLNDLVINPEDEFKPIRIRTALKKNHRLEKLAVKNGNQYLKSVDSRRKKSANNKRKRQFLHALNEIEVEHQKAADLADEEEQKAQAFSDAIMEASRLSAFDAQVAKDRADIEKEERVREEILLQNQRRVELMEEKQAFIKQQQIAKAELIELMNRYINADELEKKSMLETELMKRTREKAGMTQEEAKKLLEEMRKKSNDDYYKILQQRQNIEFMRRNIKKGKLKVIDGEVYKVPNIPNEYQKDKWPVKPNQLNEVTQAEIDAMEREYGLTKSKKGEKKGKRGGKGLTKKRKHI